MEQRELKCTFTGHREEKLGENWNEYSNECIELKERIAEAVSDVYASGVQYFICGMAEGCDLYFAEAVLELKQNHPDIRLEAAIPYAGQAKRWRASLIRRYENILRLCDVKTVLQEHYSSDCMMRRNCYMVDNSSVLIAVYNGSPGGTRNTLLYAMRSGLEIIEIEI